MHKEKKGNVTVNTLYMLCIYSCIALKKGSEMT